MINAYLICAIGFTNGERCPHKGQWLESFDHDAYNGIGFGTFTSDIRNAKRFETWDDAFEFWRKISSIKPKREDGKPNRPLTALTVSIEGLP